MLYLHQIIVARKFGSRLSIQVLPTFIHCNVVENLSDKNDIIALPVSGIFKITNSLALIGEHGVRLMGYTRNKSQYIDSLSLGFDIETSGHVFQLFFTNSYRINEVQAIPYTPSE